MAAVASPADQASALLQNLSLDSKTKSVEIPEPTKKPSVDSGYLANGQTDKSMTPLLPDYFDPSAAGYVQSWYPTAYYYGYDTNGSESEDCRRYMNSDGVEMNPGTFGDSGSVMYHGYGYAPYPPYSPATSPVPTLGQDGQTYGAQHYQYPNPYFQPLTPTSGSFPNAPVPAKSELTTSLSGNTAVDSKNSKSGGITHGGGAKGRGAAPASYYQDPRFGYDGLHSPMSWYENPSLPMTSSVASGNGVPSSRNQNYNPNYQQHLMHSRPGMNTASGYMSGMYPNKLYGQYGNSYRSGMGYGSNYYGSRMNGRGWFSVDSKYKPRGRSNGFYNESIDGLNELNRGPRAKITKNPTKGFIPVALAIKGQNSIPITVTANDEKVKSVTPDREQYNRADLPETYADAKFFIIKSYSEDDVHKSIKYNIWSSTPNGNKKLDAAYSEAQLKPDGCPVFLFFSVNTSGQFVGVAEMVGPVDFEKNVEYWQQDKWVGCFPVKWHIVKDVPNSMLKHIILEYNENKPVTNSRDTQEVKLDQGLEVFKIFKEYTSRQCILDDFDFYEDRQKRIQEKKAKQQQFMKQTPQLWESKTGEEKNRDSKGDVNGDVEPHNSSQVSLDLDKATPAAVEVADKGAFGDNGSLMYPLGYGYAPYPPYSPATSPVPTLGQEGQTYGAQHYQYPNPYFQSLNPTSGSFSNPTQGVDSRNSKPGGNSNGMGAKGRPASQNSSVDANGKGAILASYYQDPRFGYEGLHSPISWYDNPYMTNFSMNSSVTSGNGVHSSRNHNYQPQLMGIQHSRAGMNAANVYLNGMYSNKLHGTSYRSGRMDYGANYYGSRMNGRGLYNESIDGLNELNRGPRGKITQNPTKEFLPVALAVKGQNNIPINLASPNEKGKSATPDREQYNRPDLPETYTDAKFFVIKSYSEDDVHKSIKYNVWSSTPNGNKKLNTAYSEAQKKSGGCPVFLFFSVNTSGQFVGVAEMVGPVDFDKNVDCWQQDKWVGCFPVKWHIVKDVPNSMLKHIILEYNENKPVTNSRDTQEVKLEQGLEVFKIFKDHTSVQCILDDFDFYEDRQKRIKEKKAKQQQFLKLAPQVREGKTAEEKNRDIKEVANSEFKPQISSKVTSNLDKKAEAIPVQLANGC